MKRFIYIAFYAVLVALVLVAAAWAIDKIWVIGLFSTVSASKLFFSLAVGLAMTVLLLIFASLMGDKNHHRSRP